MITDRNCPNCKEGKLVERISHESELDGYRSIVFGAALRMGFFPISKQVTYAEYSCNQNCGYQKKERK